MFKQFASKKEKQNVIVITSIVVVIRHFQANIIIKNKLKKVILSLGDNFVE